MARMMAKKLRAIENVRLHLIVVHHSLGKRNQMRQFLYFVIYQRDICCVYSNVAANAGP